jgi:hypothetical protein
MNTKKGIGIEWEEIKEGVHVAGEKKWRGLVIR